MILREVKRIIVIYKDLVSLRRNFLINVINKETPTQVFFCTFCKTFKNFFIEHLQWRLLFFKNLGFSFNIF